jgi:hypothetical protein
MSKEREVVPSDWPRIRSSFDQARTEMHCMKHDAHTVPKDRGSVHHSAMEGFVMADAQDTPDGARPQQQNQSAATLLEVLSNLLYLAKMNASDPIKTHCYITLAEEQIAKLAAKMRSR